MAPRSPNFQTHTHTHKKESGSFPDSKRRHESTTNQNKSWQPSFSFYASSWSSPVAPLARWSCSIRPTRAIKQCLRRPRRRGVRHRQMETDLRETRCLFDLPFPGVEQQGRLFQRYTLGFSARPLSLRASLFLFIYLFWCLSIERLIERIPTRRSLSSGSTQKPF